LNRNRLGELTVHVPHAAILVTPIQASSWGIDAEVITLLLRNTPKDSREDMVFRAMGISGVTLGMSKFQKMIERCPDVSHFHLGWPQELASLAFHLLTDTGLSMLASFPCMRIVGHVQTNTVLIIKALISAKLELEYKKTNACSAKGEYVQDNLAGGRMDVAGSPYLWWGNGIDRSQQCPMSA
jgi:hypothetical protein